MGWSIHNNLDREKGHPEPCARDILIGMVNEHSNIIGGHWFVLTAAVLWGTTGTAQAFAPVGAQPAVIGAVRLAIGGLALFILAFLRGALRKGQSWQFAPTAFASISAAAYQLFFFAGIARTGVAVGTIVAIGSAPILASSLGLIFRREKPEQKWFLATLLAILGCILIIFPRGSMNIDLLGFLLALGAGTAYAIYTVASKGLLEKHPPDAVVAVVFSIGAILLSPLLFKGNLDWLAQPRGLMVALHLGLFATAAAYILFSRGLTAIPVASAVTLSLAEPLTAGTLGVLLLREQLTFAMIVGIGLVLSGLALLITK